MSGRSEPVSISIEAVELVYIETNIDASAGGHLALRIDQQVYHYQALENRLLLVREPWMFFRNYYQQLENRGLHMATLDLTAAQRVQVASYFNQELMVQQRHLLNERLLLLQRDWFASGIDSDGDIELAGLGYLQAAPDGGAAGPSYWSGLDAQLSETLSALHRLEPELFNGTTQLSRGGIDGLLSSTLEQRESLLQRQAALSGIQSGAVLNAANVVYLEQARLLAHERLSLNRLATELEVNIERQLSFPDATSGYSLLLNHARLLAVRESLKRGHWVFLNSFPEFAQQARNAPREDQLEVWQQLRSQVAQAWRVVRVNEMAKPVLDARAYARLETAAARMYQSHSDPQSFNVRAGWRPGLLMPRRSGPLSIERNLSARPHAGLAQLASQYSESMSRSYAYSLFNQNCVTQLMQALNQGAASAGEVQAVLGAHLEPGQGIEFIPKVLFDEVTSQLKIRELRYLPSRRQQLIATMQGDQSSWQVDLRESNIWTSQAYPGSIQDDAFLFFSDGAAWLRPVQGLANVSYAVLITGLGLVTAPFDRGNRITDGLRGVFYSAPELVFINLRKGQYDMLPSR